MSPPPCHAPAPPSGRPFSPWVPWPPPPSPLSVPDPPPHRDLLRGVRPPPTPTSGQEWALVLPRSHCCSAGTRRPTRGSVSAPARGAPRRPQTGRVGEAGSGQRRGPELPPACGPPSLRRVSRPLASWGPAVFIRERPPWALARVTRLSQLLTADPLPVPRPPRSPHLLRPLPRPSPPPRGAGSQGAPVSSLLSSVFFPTQSSLAVSPTCSGTAVSLSPLTHPPKWTGRPRRRRSALGPSGTQPTAGSRAGGHVAPAVPGRGVGVRTAWVRWQVHVRPGLF